MAPEHESGLWIVELDRRQCVELLSGAPIARVVLSIDCLPVVLPVNFAMRGEDVVFRTERGGKLTAAVAGQVVSVETDDFDFTHRTGWSVLVTGRSQLVTEPADIEWARSRLPAWGPGPHPFLVSVSLTMISGQRLLWVPDMSRGE